MSHPAFATVEAALRVRKLDRTLTTALPSLERTDPAALVPTDVAAVDACLRGGVPRGQLSEIAGPRSSGRTTLLLQLITAAARRGEIAALVDTFDRLDVASACAAGLDLDRLLWIRGDATTTAMNVGAGFPHARFARAGGSRPASHLLERTIDRALKALNLVLQAGGFGVVAIDLADVPPVALKAVPFTTWMRVQRTVEGSDTACVLVVPEPLARSAGGITLTLGAAPQWTGRSDRSRRLAGLDMTARVVSPRRRVQGDVRLVATATHHDSPRHRGTEEIRGFSSVSQCLGVSLSL